MWNYYENGIIETYDYESLTGLYETIVDKTEYATFSDWLYDMEKMSILNRI